MNLRLHNVNIHLIFIKISKKSQKLFTKLKIIFLQCPLRSNFIIWKICIFFVRYGKSYVLHSFLHIKHYNNILYHSYRYSKYASICHQVPVLKTAWYKSVMESRNENGSYVLVHTYLVIYSSDVFKKKTYVLDIFYMNKLCFIKN